MQAQTPPSGEAPHGDRLGIAAHRLFGGFRVQRDAKLIDDAKAVVDAGAFAVVVEHGGYGAKFAAPIARQIVEAAEQLGIIKSNPSEVQ